MTISILLSLAGNNVNYGDYVFGGIKAPTLMEKRGF